MIKKLTMLSLIVFGVFLINVKSALADIINIKADAPQTYVVTKGDTLWDISNLFLDQPWLWPELWRNNTQIENPHLIYPGDVLRLRYVDGQPLMEIVRDKKSIALSPESVTTTKPSPIGVLPWKVLRPYFNNDSIVDIEEYKALPKLLGNSDGRNRFVHRDFILSHKPMDTNQNYEIVRSGKLIKNHEGTIIGYQVKNIGEVELIDANAGEQQIVRVVKSHREARPGDRLRPVLSIDTSDLVLKAATAQRGRIIANIEDRSLINKRDVVVLDLGSAEVELGMVLGIYSQGPAIYDGEEPEYEFKKSAIKEIFTPVDRIQQPAFKIGELVVFKTFDNASYAWVTKATKHMKGGEHVGKP